jgi:CBS domain-containing protein
MPTTKANRGTKKLHRVGPFGPAKALLPPIQKLLLLPENMPVKEAVAELINHSFSQAPVLDAHRKVVGMFSFKRVSQRVMEFAHSRIEFDFRTLCVKDCMDKPQFIGPNEFINTTSAADFRMDDCVIVGSERKVWGLLTVADMFSRLNDFAEAFVLIFEIEHSLRDLISERLQGHLQGAFDRLNDKRKANAFKDGHYIKSLTDCTFGDYRVIITEGSRWPHFEQCFALNNKDLLVHELEEANHLRNDLLHFKRQITKADTTILQAFRDKLTSALASAPSKPER